jgi:Uma2 family endonuclease
MSSGVAEYWVIDPQQEVIRVYRRDGETFARPVELASAARDILIPPVLSGLELPVSRVFGAS